MFKQLFFEDVKIGINLPVLKKKVSSQQLVMYAGASGDCSQNLLGKMLHTIIMCRTDPINNLIDKGFFKNF